MHSDIFNYTKLAFNSLQMIQNDTVYQPIKQGDDRPLIWRGATKTLCRQRSDAGDTSVHNKYIAAAILEKQENDKFDDASRSR